MAEPSVAGELSPFTAPDGVELYAKTWKAVGATKAKLLYLHGFSDHIGHTAELFPSLTKAGIEVHALDQRGFGRSVKKAADKGDTCGTPQVMADITGFIQSKLPSDVPVFLAGHSMGGGEVLYYAANGPKETLSRLAGILAVAPWIALDPKVQPWGITVALGRFVSHVLPKFKIKNHIDVKLISRDPASNKLFEQDDMCHDTGTLQMFAGCLDRAAELRTGSALPQPEVKSLWLGHGTADQVTSWEASESYHRRVQHKDFVLKLYPEAYHALHVEPETQHEYFQDIIDFMLARAKASEPQSKL